MAARTAKTMTPEDQASNPDPQAEDAAATAGELNIFERIAAISREAGALAPESKGGVPFAFRGVDGTVAHLTPFLNKYGVFLAPAGIEHEVTEREIYSLNKSTGEMVPSGRIVKTTQIEQKFDVYGPDGYGFTIQTAGLADDFADRSTAQAQSVAYRVALLQLFHLPTHTKEPEESGEDVQKQIAAVNAGETTAPTPVTKAQAATAAAAAVPDIKRLQNEAKALGRKLNKTSSEMNAMGEEVSGLTDADVWFNDPEVMGKIVATLKAQAEAK